MSAPFLTEAQIEASAEREMDRLDAKLLAGLNLGRRVRPPRPRDRTARSASISRTHRRGRRSMIFDLINFARTSDLRQRIASLDRRIAKLEAERSRLATRQQQQPAPTASTRPVGAAIGAVVAFLIVVAIGAVTGFAIFTR